MIDADRIHPLNEQPVQPGEYVLYWMQASQRTRFNHALEYAILGANELKLPAIVCFGLMDDYPEANARHYAFMLQGLRDVQANLAKRGIKFIVKHGSPPEVALHYAKSAAVLVTDRGYTRHQKRWRDEVADSAKCQVIEVESDVVVPVEVASNKREFAARTIRPKIHKHLKHFLRPLAVSTVKKRSIDLPAKGDIDVSDPEAALKKLKLDRSVAPVERFEGGENSARKRLQHFVRDTLDGYDEKRNEPSIQHTSTLSPYLHFGQISPLEIALTVAKAQAKSADRDAYLEELIVRRELASNFVHYTPNYDAYECLPDWARKTLSEHRRDPREHLYSRKQLEAAQTFDPYWNAAQLEMTRTGYMHNYMRMYWGKKIIEWSKTPEAAYETTIELNNKYFLDGRDPNAWCNVGWLFGLHDRPWGPARKIFGTVRYMNAAGLERKFDMDAYVAWVDTLPKALTEQR